MKRISIGMLCAVMLCAVLLCSCALEGEPAQTQEQTTAETKAIYRIPSTATTRSEPPEIEEQIQKQLIYSAIPSKVIIECAGERLVPTLVQAEASYYDDEWEAWQFLDGYNMFGFAGYEPEKEAGTYPTVRVSAGDTLEVYVNDVLAECPVVVVDGKGEELLRIEDTAELPSALAKGSHYAYVDVACEGDIIVDHGREETEYAWYRAYFILEIV